jgi:hypothetical protein
MADVPVKIDKELKEEVEGLLSEGLNRIEYPSVKNFIDKAVLKMLEDIRGADGKK